MDFEATPPGEAQTLGRAVELLRLIAAHGGPGARLLDLATESGLARPTVHRLLKRLCAERLAAQDPTSKRYLLGSLAFELGLAARSPLKRLDRLRPEIDALAAATEDTVYLIMRTGDELLCLHVAEGAFPIRARTFDVGVRRPLGTGAAGLALLAAMREDEAHALVARNAERLGRLGTEAHALLERVAQARAHGAVGRGTIEGVTGVAMAVPTRAGSPYLAVSIGAISARMPDARIARLWKLLRPATKRIAVIEESAV